MEGYKMSIGTGEIMHIKKVELKRFKQFKDSKIELKESLSLIVGGNNSGKSSLLQALATWQFCKSILEIEKGRQSWITTAKNQGLGLGIIDFTPMYIPSLSHLWTNLNSQKQNEQDGYTLKINVFWDDENGNEKYLEIGLSLANDRLFIKTTSTNLNVQDVLDVDGNPLDGKVPEIAYLPPFAGITDREVKHTPAMRNRLIGQGLSGGVIRNSIYELHSANQEKRISLKGERSKIKTSDLKELRLTDPWEILQKTMQDIFSTQIKVTPFNEKYHSYLRIECVKGSVDNGIFKKYPKYNSRDIMVEGSGFLQWLSVYTLALSPSYNVILLDEPDAHLHTLLQTLLTNKLETIANSLNKQVLLATHSTELIRIYPNEKILGIDKSRGKYLSLDTDKIKLLSGIGTIHTPKLHNLIKDKKLLIIEGVSDERFLKEIAKKLDYEWPSNLTTWLWTGKSSERYQLFLQLKKEIPELKALSLRDRDDDADNSVDANLSDKGIDCPEPGFTPLKWRRRHIENYFLDIDAIVNCTGKERAEIDLFFREKHALAIPENFKISDVSMTIRDARGKEILTKGEDSIEGTYAITREDILKEMASDNIPDDIHKFLDHLKNLCDI